MKYGLLYYKDTNNIGDDIQSYAASRFMPRIDYMIDREHLNDFVPDKKEYVKTIMNSWYIHDKFNFDFSPYIYPLFISMFFKKFPYQAGVTVGVDYLNENVVKTFKKYSPIGTRDKHTLKIMNQLGVDSYFSGCLTLTLNKFDGVKKGDYIVAVGLTKKELAYLRSKTKREVIEFVQDVKLGSFSEETWDQRKQRVEDILKLYQGAHLVVTNKLHCSLPCLALETPVLLLYDTSFPENKDRIGTYITYLNYVKREEFFNTDLNLENPKPNPKKYLAIRKQLIDSCSKFISDDIKMNISDLPDVNVYKSLSYKNNVQKQVIIKYFNLLSSKYEKECLKSSKLFREVNDLKYRNEQLEKDLNLMKNSRGWRFLEKIRKILRIRK